ncbi:hydroxyacylglutathione hydrolase [Gilvimarinus sp. DA14]|uniref:hydroxyacylglutathione hydrolase n=1 Tax=Gilvimarinus sp. DA14 TaxID=2956798 RepID=UPI0020B6881B|nr:hydroxyacylglutathione hydrolase [Gilvimarinus sp. DA14]UTF60581.1 hydroxyacylglutathione hydrolase [Gilvimarinus sp. DA14]
MRLFCFPALQTNYFWLLQPDPDSNKAYIFDPGDAAPVRQQLREHGLELAGIVITHHHWDHTDGIDPLLEYKPVPVYGPSSRKIPQVTHTLQDGDTLVLGELKLQVIATPGHTLEHIAYYLPGQPPRLFSADNIFGAGCGRMFEGTPDQFLNSLKRLSELPPETLICCSHEYTVDNIHFALTVEPGNQALRDRKQREEAKRARQLPTIPTTLQLELATNPFLRTAQSEVKASAERHLGRSLNSESEVFAAIRAWKDSFVKN